MKVSNLAQLDQRLECLSGPADYAFLLNIHGIVKEWSFPYYSAMDYTLTKDSYQWIIAELYKIDLTVLLTVCDMGMFILIVSSYTLHAISKTQCLESPQKVSFYNIEK